VASQRERRERTIRAIVSAARRADDGLRHRQPFANGTAQGT